MASVETVEPGTPAEPLRLECGHLLTAVVKVDGEPRCGACADLAEIVQAEAEEEIDDAVLDPVLGDHVVEEHDQLHDSGQAVEEPAGTLEEQGGERQDGGDQDSPPQPVYGTRSDTPGPRGCWALNNQGQPCGAMKRRDGDYCTAHAGLGVAADPRRWAPVAHAARREQLATRARLRLTLGDRGRISARSVLREKALLNAERLAGTTIAAALSPDTDPVKAANLSLAIIREAEPREQATLEISAEQDIESMGLAQLIALAAERGLDLSRPEPNPPELPE